MEKVHDISIDEPTVAHQAILFMLDVLMRNDNQALSIAQLYDSFGDKSFSPQMLRAVGGNEQGLKQFLLRYPSLFTVIGDNVSANSGNSMRTTPERTTYLKRNKSANNEDLTSAAQTEHDSKTMKEIEQEAIAFFKKQMNKREEDWLPIVSVAGHASQSSTDIRKFVGPQNEFKSFLLKYPHIFFVRDEYCGLKGRADQSTQPFPPPSPPPKRRLGLNRTHSFKNRYSTGGSIANLMPNQSNGGSILNQSSQNGNVTGSGIAKPRLTPLEVKAVHYVMRILHKQNRLPLQTIPGLISRAPEHVSNIVGFTREDLIQFFKRHSAIFQLHPDGCVSVKQDAIKALILKDVSFDSSIFSGVGTILRLFPKYGILNLANNEQVFFDIQSCQFETFGDLTTVLKPTERLHFNAVIGPRDGSTKWRSIKTWINTQEMVGDHSVSSDAGKSDDSSTNGYSTNSINDANHQNYNNTHLSNHNNSSTNNGNNMSSSQHQFNNVQSGNNTNLLYTQLNDEEFNQYQLDGEYNDNDSLQNECVNNTSSSSTTTTTTTGTIKTSVSMNNVQQHQLQQQSIQHNQQQQNNGKSSDIDDDFHCLSISSSNSLPIISNNGNSNTTGGSGSGANNLPASPSPTSFISSATSSSQLKLININTNTTQMVMKHASDNISKREVCSNSRFVNMGCQTVSTGDIMTTNVYIE